MFAGSRRTGGSDRLTFDPGGVTRGLAAGSAVTEAPRKLMKKAIESVIKPPKNHILVMASVIITMFPCPSSPVGFLYSRFFLLTGMFGIFMSQVLRFCL